MTSLHVKFKTELKTVDYARLAEFFNKNNRASITLFSSVDLEFVSVSPVMVNVEGLSYKISGEIMFQQPIGFEIYDNLLLDDNLREGVKVNRRNFKLSKIVTELDFENGLTSILKSIERIVNHVCNRFGRLIEQNYILNSDALDKQLDLMLKKNELEKRGEILRPFGTIHAKSAKDVKERAGNLVPIYLERDKYYLYEDKNVYVLLPRSFVMKLLKIEESTMLAVDQFKEEEREVLNKFSMRNYIKTRRIGGKPYYCDLNEKTRKLLLRGMKETHPI